MKRILKIYLLIALICSVAMLVLPVIAQEPEAEPEGGLLGALEALKENEAAYRLVIGLIVAVIINIFGFAASKFADWTGVKYSKAKFGETLMVYEPLILLLPEALPMKYAIVGAIIIDLWRHTYKALKTT